MFRLNAVAIYRDPEGNPRLRKNIAQAPSKDAIKLFGDNPCTNFEKHTLPILPAVLEQDRTYETQSHGEQSYVKKIPGDDFFMMLCFDLKKSPEPKEIHYLFINLRHAFLKPSLVKMNDLLTNTLGFIGKDRAVTQLQQEMEELKESMLHHVNIALENSAKVDALLEKSDSLQLESVRFNRQAAQLNRGCCGS